MEVKFVRMYKIMKATKELFILMHGNDSRLGDEVLEDKMGMRRTLVSFLPSTHSVRLLYPITSPLNQSGFVRPGPARSLGHEFFFAKIEYAK